MMVVTPGVCCFRDAVSDEVKEFVELTQDIVSKGLDRHLYLQEQEFLVRKLLVNMGVGIESHRNRNSW